MACGCETACGCNIVGDGVTAEVARVGDTFTVSSINPIMAVDDTDCIELSVAPDKTLTADIILDTDPASVELTCEADGLHAEVVPDPASTAIVSVSADGLRVDVPPPAAGSYGPQAGDLVYHGGIGTRAGAIDADGSDVLRASYPALWDALSLKATTATRTAGVAIVTDIPSTRFMAAGMAIELTSFPFGSTILSVDSGTTITVDNPAGDSGSDTEVRVYPHGNGDGITTFNVPNMSDVFPLGYDYAGATLALGSGGGSGSATLTEANLPAHDHPAAVTDPGHDHTASSVDAGHDHGGTTGNDGSHTHETSTAGRVFVEVESATAQQVRVAEDGGGTIDIVVDANDPNTTYGQKSDASTDTEGNHAHTISSDSAAITTTVNSDVTGITVDVQDDPAHVADPIDVLPPYLVGRWMVIV